MKKQNKSPGAKVITPPKNSYYNVLGFTIISMLGIIIYSNSFNCTFHFDDFHYIVNNANIAGILNLKTLWKLKPDLYAFISYRPIPMFTFALNYHFNQLDVWYYHLFNLAIHIINACLTGWLTLLILSSPALKNHPVIQYKKALALLTALLFVSHPLSTASVTYIIQRMNLMAAMFYFLSVSLYMSARLSDKSKLIKYLLFAGSFVSALFALLSKQNAFTLPAAIVLVEFFFFRTRQISINFKDYRAILFAAFSGISIILFIILSQSIFKPHQPSENNDFTTITSLNYLFTQFSVIVKYIQLLLLPINLNFDDAYPLSTGFFETRTLFSLLFLISLVVLAIFLFKKHRIISFGIFWFFLTLSVESSVIPIDDLIVEHRTYLPSFGFFLILSYGAFLMFRNNYKNLSIGILVIIIVINSGLTYSRNIVWENDITLWSDVILKYPHKARPFNNLGIAYVDLGKYEEAISNYDSAIILKPNYVRAYNNRGNTYSVLKQYDKAIQDCNSAILIKPDNDGAYNNLGYAYNALGKYEEAIKNCNSAILIKPDYAEAYNNRAIAYSNLKQYDNAIKDFSAAIRAKPGYDEAYNNRGTIYFNLKQYDNAVKDYNSVILIKPDNAGAYNNLANAYNVFGKYEEAIKNCNTAIRISPDYAQAYYNRGIAYFNLKQYENSIKDYSSAILINPNYAEAYNNRGSAYLMLKQYDNAIKDYSSAIRINPDNASFYMNLSLSYRGKGDIQSAEQCLQKYNQIASAQKK